MPAQRHHDFQRPRRGQEGRDRGARREGLRVLNATCPLVSKVHSQGRHYMRQGRTVVLIGHAGHPEVEGTLGQIPGPVLLVETEDDVAAMTLPSDTPIAYVTQTTLSVDDTRGIIAALYPPFQGRGRARARRIYAMRHKIGNGAARTHQAGRRDLRGRRQKQLEFEPAVRDRASRPGTPTHLDRRRQLRSSRNGCTTWKSSALPPAPRLPRSWCGT